MADKLTTKTIIIIVVSIIGALFLVSLAIILPIYFLIIKRRDTSTSGGGGPQATMSGSDNVWVTEHNKSRSEVGAPSVTWDDALALGAAEWANKCQLVHSSTGENIAMAGPASSFTDRDMINLWQSEKQYYRPGDSPSLVAPVTGHYTQMINRNVKKIGCACSTNCPNNMKTCVCRYDYIQQGPP